MFMINWHTIAEKLRQHRRGCAILVLFFSVFLVSLIWIRPSRISHANYERIRKGMTVDQVTKLLGPCSDKTFGRWPPGPNWFSSITWTNGRNQIMVHFPVKFRGPGTWEGNNLILDCEDEGAAMKSFTRNDNPITKILFLLGVTTKSNFVHEQDSLE
jgi:hypothetical protein